MRAPDIETRVGRAWHIRIQKLSEPDHAASVSSWILNANGFHPFWSWWSINVISLRDIEGVRPAFKQYPQAEYEFGILSLNPEYGDPDIDRIEVHDEGLRWLLPQDVQIHFHGVRDDQAAHICELAVRGILAGQMSPDQDFRRAWSDLIRGTVEHYRQGKHEVPS